MRMYYCDHRNRFNRMVSVYFARSLPIDFISTEHFRDYVVCHELKRSLVIEDGGPFYVFDFDDKPHIGRVARMAQDADCRAVFKAQYCSQNVNQYRTCGTRVYPYTYFPRDPHAFQSCKKQLLQVEKEKSGLFFRGQQGNRRECTLEHLTGILSGGEKKVSMSDYLAELAQHKIALSLPGTGNFNHREIECFGIGVAALMPRLTNSYHEDLVPNMHYVCVDIEDTDSPRLRAQKIKDRYSAVVDNRDFLQHIAHNALDWFRRNIQYPNCMQLAKSLMSQQRDPALGDGDGGRHS